MHEMTTFLGLDCGCVSELCSFFDNAFKWPSALHLMSEGAVLRGSQILPLPLADAIARRDHGTTSQCKLIRSQFKVL